MSDRSYVFVAYSTREEHVGVFLDCLEQVIRDFYGDAYHILITPTFLKTSESQLTPDRASDPAL